MAILDIFKKKGWLAGTLIVHELPPRAIAQAGYVVVVTFCRVDSASAPPPSPGQYDEGVVVKQSNELDEKPLRFRVRKPAGFYYLGIRVSGIFQGDGKSNWISKSFFPMTFPREVEEGIEQVIQLSATWPDNGQTFLPNEAGVRQVTEFDFALPDKEQALPLNEAGVRQVTEFEFALPGKEKNLLPLPTVFRPKFPLILYLVSFIVIPVEILFIWLIISQKMYDLLFILMAVVLALVIAINLFAMVFRIRQITFGANSFLIEKFLRPTRTVEYADIVDFDTGSVSARGVTFYWVQVVTRQDKIFFSNMANWNELANIFRRLIEQGAISRSQREDKLKSSVATQEAGIKAIWPSLAIAGALWSITYIIWPFENSLVSGWGLGLFFLIWIPIQIVLVRFFTNRV